MSQSFQPLSNDDQIAMMGTEAEFLMARWKKSNQRAARLAKLLFAVMSERREIKARLDSLKRDLARISDGATCD